MCELAGRTATPNLDERVERTVSAGSVSAVVVRVLVKGPSGRLFELGVLSQSTNAVASTNDSERQRENTKNWADDIQIGITAWSMDLFGKDKEVNQGRSPEAQTELRGNLDEQKKNTITSSQAKPSTTPKKPITTTNQANGGKQLFRLYKGCRG